MKKTLFLMAILACAWTGFSQVQMPLDSLLPVRGLCVGAPAPDDVKDFVKFIRKELIPMRVNTLVLRIDFQYQFESHPELRSEHPLSRKDIQQLVEVCKEGNIKLIPQINLLGHQSWAGKIGGLLKAYPEFDETPHVQMPTDYKWPNADGLYCKSYCPLHPKLHKIVFDVVDEIVKAFEATAFHAGMDEVFYIGNEKCPRCNGLDKAELFAGEVTVLLNHLAQQNKLLWIWGDRLLDGKTTGLGMWEASMNHTHKAIDLIPKDVVINDWHYEQAVPTDAYFAAKGFRVITCPWRRDFVGLAQLEATLNHRKNATKEMKKRFEGVMQTIWTDARSFMDQYYGKVPAEMERGGNQVKCFKAIFEAMGKWEAKK